jgi:hypothetical protein
MFLKQKGKYSHIKKQEETAKKVWPHKNKNSPAGQS